MIEALVTSAGLLLHDAEFLWLRSTGAKDSVLLIVGSSMASAQPDPDARVWLARSMCNQWSPDLPGCTASTILVALSSEPEYDVVVWSEAPDRMLPLRDRIDVAAGWRFEAGDIDLDGRLTCADLARFIDAKYDWNHDGAADMADQDDLEGVLVTGRADFDGSGAIDVMDFLFLQAHWGGCPPPAEACPADLDCDGQVGMGDVLLLLSALAG